MSGVAKGLKKVWKKERARHKKLMNNPVVRVILIAVAIYFTAGLAAGAMGSTTAAALPGITSAANTLGITSGAFAGASTYGALSTGAMTAMDAMAAAEWFGGVGAGTSPSAGLFGSAGIEGAVSALGDVAAGVSEVGVETGAAVVNGGAEATAAVVENAAPGLVESNLGLEQGLGASEAGSVSNTAVANTAPSTPLNAAPSAQPSTGSNLWETIKGKWGKLDATEKMLVGKGVGGLIQGGMGAYQQSQVEEQQEQARQDALRRGRVPDLTNWVYTPRFGSGLIDGNKGGG